MWDMARRRDLSFARRVLYGVALATETNSNGAVSPKALVIAHVS
jgi:hypothetical protein